MDEGISARLMIGCRLITALIVFASLVVLVRMFTSDDPDIARLHAGLDIQGGTILVFRMDVSEGTDSALAVENAASVLRNRYDEGGITASVLRRSDGLEVQLEDATPDEAAAARDLATRNARLELRLVDEDAHTLDQLELPAGVRRSSENVGGSMRTYLVAEGDAGRQRLLDLGRQRALRVALARVPSYDAAYDPHQERWRTYLVGDAELTGADVVDASVVTRPDSRAPIVSVTFSERAAATLLELTQNVGSRLAIILNDEVVSAPLISMPIPGGRAHITLGPDASLTDAYDLSIMLRAGALPDPLILEHEHRIEAAQPEIAWGTLGGGLLVFLVFAAFGTVQRRARGLALALPLLIVPVSFALLAYMHATATAALFAGVILTGFVSLGAAYVTRARFEPSSPRITRILLTLLPAAVCACLFVASGMLYVVAAGPLRGAAVGMLATSLVGTPLAAMWITSALGFEL